MRAKESLEKSDDGIGGKRIRRSKAPDESTGLSALQVVLASFFLVLWLVLFGGGITMDTTKFRCALSTGGALALATEARPGEDAAKTVCERPETAGWIPIWSSNLESPESKHTYRLFVAWLGILLFFLPLNLAMVSGAAGALGALGNKANLDADPAKRIAEEPQGILKSMDVSSPIMSGLLRGLFVYLFFISGLLLFDDKPFSSPGPGQYIRLAGFISLISFLVNYRPDLFATISEWAFERINAGKGIHTHPEEDGMKVERTRERNEKTTLTIQMPANGQSDEQVLPATTEATPQK